LRSIDHLIIDRRQSGGFGDATGNPVDHPDLVGIHIAALECLGLIPQYHRQLIGNEFPRFGPLESRHLRFWCGSGLFADPGIGVPDRQLGQPSLRSSNLPAGISHRVPTGGLVVLFFPCHAFIVTATTDSFRTRERI
jgi:hypothetical protein